MSDLAQAANGASDASPSRSNITRQYRTSVRPLFVVRKTGLRHRFCQVVPRHHSNRSVSGGRGRLE